MYAKQPFQPKIGKVPQTPPFLLFIYILLMYACILLQMTRLKNILKIKLEKSVTLWGDAVKIMKTLYEILSNINKRFNLLRILDRSLSININRRVLRNKNKFSHYHKNSIRPSLINPFRIVMLLNKLRQSKSKLSKLERTQ
jgi:hypothetical protein